MSTKLTTRQLESNENMRLATALFTDGMDLNTIAEKLEISRNHTMRLLNRSGARQPSRTPNKQYLSPCGKPLAIWLRENNFRYPGYYTIINRLRRGYSWHEALYTTTEQKGRPRRTGGRHAAPAAD